MALTVDRFNPDPSVRFPLPGAVYRLAVGEPLTVEPPTDRAGSIGLARQVEHETRVLHAAIRPGRLEAMGQQFA